MNFRRWFRELGIGCLSTLALSSALAQTSTPVGTSSAIQTATVTITTAGTAATVLVTTQGAQNLEYSMPTLNTGTCAALAQYTVGQTCTVQYTFTPAYPFTRRGSATVYDANGNVLGNTFLNGIGTGPQVSYPLSGSNTAAALAVSVSNPNGVAVDAAGNVYIADTQNNAVKEIRASDGVVLTLGSGFSSPTAVAVDGAGNVYVADTGHNLVKEIIAANGAITPPAPLAPVTLASSFTFSNPQGVAVDGSGNVYVADKGNGAIEKILAVNGAIPAGATAFPIGSTFAAPAGVAVDAQGNVYVADPGNNTAKEIVAATGMTISLGSGLNSPQSIAVDGMGNVYVADLGNNAVKEFAVVSGPPASISTTAVLLAGGFNMPAGVAVDSNGTVYVADSRNSAIEKVAQTVPSLTFQTTTLGSTSTDSPQPVIVQNSGNMALSFPVPTSGSNPAISPSFTVNAGTGCPLVVPSATTPGMLGAGATCTYAVGFSPVTAGTPVTGSLTLTDNALNATNATQSIALSGNATAGTPTVSVSSPSVTFGATSVTLTASVGYAGVTPMGAFSFTVNGGSPILANCPGTASPITCSASYVPSSLMAGSYAIQGTIAADSNYNSASSNGTLTISMATPTVTLSTPSPSSTVDSAVTFTASITPTTGTVPTGSVSFYTIANGANTPIVGCTGLSPSGNRATCTTRALPAGTDTIGASIAGDTNFNSATAAPITETVTAGSVTLTTTSSQPTSSVNQAVTFTATLSSNSPFVIVPTGSVSFTTGGATIPTCGAVPIDPTLHSASCTATALVAPADLIAATYTSGDANFGNATAATFGQTVTKIAPVNGITSSLGTSSVNQSVTFVATVTPDNHSNKTVVPMGNVTFTNGPGGPRLCPQAPVIAVGDGTATLSCQVAFSAVSSNTAVYAVYSGDSNFLAGNSPMVSQVVSAAATSISSASISTNPSSPTAGSTVAVSATLTPAFSGSAQPTGIVTFTDSSTGKNCMVAVNPNGVTSCPSLTVGGVGTDTITVSYAGDGNFASSTGTNTVAIVTSSAVTINLSTSGTPVTVNQSATYSAAFAYPTKTSTYPSGTVQYFDGSTAIANCNVSISAAGVIPNCVEQLGTAGNHVIHAEFSGDANYNKIVSGNLAQGVNQNTTTTTLTAPTAASLVDQVVTYAATVTPGTLTPAATGTVAPSGSVQFSYLSNGANVLLCNAAIPSSSTGTSSASCAAANLPGAGTYSITAAYSGDSNFLVSTSAPRSQVVNKTGTSLVLVPGSTFSSPASPAVNQSATYTVQLTLANSISSAGLTQPTGSVTFRDAINNVSCTAPLASGQASCSLAEPTSGTRNITVSYAGDNNFSAYSTTFPVTIAASSTSIAASSIFTNPSQPTLNQPNVMLNATLTTAYSGSALPTGTLVFSDSAPGMTTPGICNTTVTNGVVAPCSYVFTTPGTHTLTANYQGDANFSAVTQTNTLTIGGVGALGISLASTTGAVIVNQQANYSAVFTPTQTGPTYPTGSVQYSDGGIAIPGCNFTVGSNGTIASCTETMTTAGTHVITALFTSNNLAAFANAPSGNLPQLVNQNGTRVSLTSPNATSSVNQSVTFAALLAPAPLTPAGIGSTLPTGSVTFNATNASGITTALCAGTVSTTGGVTSASCVAPFTAAASYGLTAAYSGDANFLAGNSSSYSQVVAKTGTAVTLVSGSTLTNPASPAANQSATYTVQVTPAISPNGPTLPTGNVTFTDMTANQAGCTAVLVASTGQASCSFATTGNGVHNITAVYTGDTNFNTSTQTFTESIALASPTLTITQPAVNPTINLPGFAFNATLALPAGSVGQPTGTVKFTDSAAGTAFCTSTLSAGVIPPCSYIFGSAGMVPHTITATYSGDSSFASATSTINLSVAQATPVISLVSAAPISVASQQVSFTATVTPSPAAYSIATGTPTGAINFSFPSGSVVNNCTSTPISSGGVETATCVVTFAPYAAGGTGAYNVTATYSGDSNYLTTQRTIVQNVQGFTPALSQTAVAVGQGDSNSSDPFATGSSIVYTLTAQAGFSNATTTTCPSTVPGLTCSVPSTFALGSSVPVVISATTAVAPGVYPLQVVSRDSATSLTQTTSFTVTVISRVFPSGSTVPYSVPTAGQAIIPLALSASLSGSTYTCNPNVANVVANGAYRQTGDTLANLGLACSITGSGSSYTVTITAGSGVASLERGPLSGTAKIVAAGFFAPFLLVLGFAGRTKRMRTMLLRATAVGLISLATLYSTGCSSGGFTRGSNQTFAVGGSYLIGISNASGVTVAEVPLLVTGNGAGI